MTLDSFHKSQSKRLGGITVLRLVRIDDISEVYYDAASGICQSIVLEAGTCFAVFGFREDSGIYKESAMTVNGIPAVCHEISFDLARLDGDSHNAFGQLLSATGRGMAALVTTACGETFLVGHSPELGPGQPLKLKNCSGTTGCRPYDATGYSVTLYCESPSPAMLFGGVLP